MYVGRFAPSPTGPLHFGSVVAALASWLDARAHDGRWLVRIEDLDPPRESAAAPDLILSLLDALGLSPDGDILFQSTRLAAYDDALAQLWRDGYLFPCTCPRKETRGVYRGTCRENLFDDNLPSHAVRVRTRPVTAGIDDLFRGRCEWQVERDAGDFIVRRRDGLVAYQLAVVVDDDFQDVTHVIRGYDLLDSTPRQLWLQQCLDLAPPVYGHVPVVCGADGAKLSKQTGAAAADATTATLLDALRCLGQPLPDISLGVDNRSLLDFAIRHWSRNAVPPVDFVAMPGSN